MRMPVTITSVPVVLLLAACAGSASVEDRMFDHFGRAGHIQTSLIMGDLDGARRPASWLAEHDDLAGTAPGSERWTAQIREESRAVELASSIEVAADATGRLAAACSGCHTSMEGGPRFRSAGEAPPVESRGTHMIRHLWGMDRMWEGLIGGSDESWISGARAIAEDDYDDGFAGGSATAALAETLHRQATQAERAPRSARPAAYAEMIKACAGCHALTGAGAD